MSEPRPLPTPEPEGSRAVALDWGATLAEHEARGGRIGSRWAAAGVGMLYLAAFAAVIVAGALWLGGQHKVVIGTKDEVYFVGSATKQDAQALGAALQKEGFFSDKGFAVILTKDQDGTAISFVVKPGAWDDPQMQAGVQELGRKLAPAVGGLPIKVRMVDDLKRTKKEFVLQPGS